MLKQLTLLPLICLVAFTANSQTAYVETADKLLHCIRNLDTAGISALFALGGLKKSNEINYKECLAMKPVFEKYGMPEKGSFIIERKKVIDKVYTNIKITVHKGTGSADNSEAEILVEFFPDEYHVTDKILSFLISNYRSFNATLPVIQPNPPLKSN